jgi:Cys-rich repeat protein
MLHRTLFALLVFAALAACGGATHQSSIGGACSSDNDCHAGLFCETTDPGGQCVKTCTTDLDCGSGAVCNSEKKCYAACTSSAQCRSGYSCQGVTPENFCDVAPTMDGSVEADATGAADARTD